MNEGVFRNMNEHLKALADEFDLSREPLLLVCECGHSDCDKRLGVPPAEYERIRSDPTLFAVVPGHQLAGVERVVERGEGYVVVEKLAGTPAEVAHATDPRDR
jgi:hypothetical protein